MCVCVCVCVCVSMLSPNVMQEKKASIEGDELLADLLQQMEVCTW